MGNQKKSGADHADTHRRLLSITMLVLAVIYGMETGLYFIEGELIKYVEFAEYGLVGLFFLMIGMTIYWKIKFIPVNERYLLLSTEDSYANATMNKSFKISWLLTLILLFLSTTFTGNDSSPLPAQFYLNLVAFIMLSTFSLSFIFLFRSEDEEAFEKGGV